MNSECLTLPSPAWCCPHHHSPYSPHSPSSSPCSFLPSFTKPSSAPAPGPPRLAFPSPAMASSFSLFGFQLRCHLLRNICPVEVAKPSLVTHASHCLQVYFLFSPFCYLKKNYISLFIFYSLSFPSRIEAPWGQGPPLICLFSSVSAALGSVLNKYMRM